jgi:putative transposase
MKELAYIHRKYGCPRLHVLLKKEGLVINHKRTARIYKEQELSLRRKVKKRRIPLLRIPMPPARKPDEIWSMDFMSDNLSTGRRVNILTIVDDFSRISPGILVDSSVPAKKVTHIMG